MTIHPADGVEWFYLPAGFMTHDQRERSRP
jgi:hypothetical protein